MSGNCDEESSGNAGVHTNPAKYQPETSTSIHGRNTAGNHGGYSSSSSEQSTVGQNIPRGSDNSSDFDVWVVPNFSDVKPDRGAIPKVKPAGGVFQKAWKDFHVSIERKEDMKILEQCGCKESLPPVKMQYLVNLHFKELETALCDELLKLKWNVKCVKPGDQCLSIEVKNYTDDCVVEDVILLLGDEVNKVNFCQSMQASKHPELLLKEYIDRGHLAIYVDDEKVFVVGIVENPRKVIEMLRKKPIGSDYSRTSAYKMDVQLDNHFTGQLLIYLQFLPSMKQKHSSVNVTVDEERSIMSICGNNLVDVHAAVEDVDIFTKTIAVEDIELDPLLIQLLKLQDIKTLIRKLCEEQDLKVIWTLSELNNTITCHCKDRKAVQYFSDVLKHNLEKKTYQYSKRSLGDTTMIFSTTNMFSDFVKKYDGKCLVSTVEGNSIDIFTTRGISNELALLEVNFEGTKIVIQKNLTQNEKKEIHNQKSEVTIADDGIEWIDGTKRRLNVEDVFDVVRGKINPSLKLENEVRAECIKQKMKYDEDTMEVEGTLEQLTSLRQYLITRFGEERGISTLEQKQETLPKKTRQASHPYQQAGDIERESKINYSRSSSKTYNSLAVKDLSYLTLEGLVVKVYVGNILHLNVDCIVNAANENLMHGGGVAKVISRAAGYDFQKESDDYIQNNGPLSVTECCTTSAGNLQQYKCVIHAVGPKWHEYPIDKRACAYDLQKTIVNCFKEAEIQNVFSVALPVISSGIFGVPNEVCCSQYCKAVIEYSNTHGKTTCLKKIHFMDKEPGMIQMIQAEFSLHLNITQSASASGNTGPNPSTSTTNIWSRDGKGSLSRSFLDDPDIKHHHDNPSSGNSDSNKAQTAVGKFKKQYIVGKDLIINIVEEDITKMTVDVIVCPQDEYCLSKGGIAKAISKVSNEWYRQAVVGMKRVSKCEVKRSQASPRILPFKGVLHTVVPRWDKHAVKDNKMFMKELSLTIRNIIQYCSDSCTVNSVAIPVLGIGADGNQTPYVTYACILANEISKAMKSDKFSLTEIYIVTHDWSMASAIADHFDTIDSFKKVTTFKRRNRNKDKKVVKADCVICMDKLTAPKKLQCGHIFCEECIGLQFKVKPVCPTCGSIQGIVTGDQPQGHIQIFSSRASLPGYPQCGRIHIEYTIYDGKQGDEHPNPGRSFEGIQRTAYLPDNTRGQLIAKLLRVAFERKLVFTIGHSGTTGKEGVVRWNDILHKTSQLSGTQFGYPDTTYFDRVIDELAANGVTEKDIYT